MTHEERRNLRNAQCRNFLDEFFNHDHVGLAYWLRLNGSFTTMSLIRVKLLAECLAENYNNSIHYGTSIQLSDLVLKHGFGCEVITINQIEEIIKEEHDGYCLDKVMVAA